MFIICGKENKIIFGMEETVEYIEETGYPYMPKCNTVWCKDDVDVIEVQDIPDFVEVYKYCYTKGNGFYENPNLETPKEPNPYGVSDDIVAQIRADYDKELKAKSLK